MANRVGDLFENRRLACLWWRNDEAALGFPDGRDQIEQARRENARVCFEIKPDFREDRGQLLEGRAMFGGFRVQAVDRLDTQQTKILFRVFRRADLSNHHIPGAQIKRPNPRFTSADIILPPQKMIASKEAYPPFT